jgi:hypothetical protein
MHRIIALGDRTIEDTASLRLTIRKKLQALQPTIVFSDLAPGWNILVADEAQKLGISTQGVFPHAETLGTKAYLHYRQEIYKKMRTKIAFNETIFDYYKNPTTYVTWLISNVDTVLACLDPEHSSVSHSLMLALQNRGKQVFNIV